MKFKQVETAYNTKIGIYICEDCGATYRKSYIIKRFWNFCPNCGRRIETWQEQWQQQQ